MTFFRCFLTFVQKLSIFTILGDVTYLVTIVGLLLHMYRKGSCTGISGRTQVLFGLLFTARYIDLFTSVASIYRSLLSITYVSVTYFTILSIYFKYDDSYSSEYDTFRSEILIIISAIAAVFLNHDFTVVEMSWAFSQYLEALAIIPQLYLISKAGKSEKAVSYYIFGLTAYRSFYIMNWAYRYSHEDFYDLIFIVPAIIQILLYCDYLFALLTSHLILKKHKPMHRIIDVNYPKLVLGCDAMPESSDAMPESSEKKTSVTKI